MSFDRFTAIYRSTALVFFNLLLLFIFLNVAIAVAVSVRNIFSLENPITDKYEEAALTKVYPGKTRKEIRDLLHETWSRPYIYEPFTQFKERPYRGKYVNVDVNGFRFSAGQASWPPDPAAFNVFVFGGSTTFGYGVTDAETITSYLQTYFREQLRIPARVYNFGRGYYNSTQERIPF